VTEVTPNRYFASEAKVPKELHRLLTFVFSLVVCFEALAVDEEKNPRPEKTDAVISIGSSVAQAKVVLSAAAIPETTSRLVPSGAEGQQRLVYAIDPGVIFLSLCFFDESDVITGLKVYQGKADASGSSVTAVRSITFHEDGTYSL
jgi:hypothetical protein